ncbi:DnaD domain protein [Peribacillus asahii]|uniref:DnaD domain protein n=1 Tax=Peribacillus asahii TaxID=228899 RepID=A0A398BPI9_9BACI|nr:DnaD domain-containing protein [Peribacillus asahii]RID89206.1 DnaD domain protein [Peribacillus asahii]
MIKDQLQAWFKQGTLTIPTYLLTHYKIMGLNEQELVLLLQLQNFTEKGNSFPTPSQLSEVMTFQESECLFLIQSLIQKGCIGIEVEKSQEFGNEKYTLEPLYEKMLTSFLLTLKKEEALEAQQSSESLYTIVEQEFGRPLSPFECETLAMWIDDGHEPDIIKAALREAVISGKINFRYIDRILFEWKKNGIKTLEQVRKQTQKFRAYQKRNRTQEPQEQTSSVKDIPFYNWLEQ